MIFPSGQLSSTYEFNDSIIVHSKVTTCTHIHIKETVLFNIA